MTSNSNKTEEGREKRRIISYEPSPENLDYIEEKKKDGIPYNFTLDRALDGARQGKRKAKAA